MQIITKDITSVTTGVIAHVVNDRGVMGAGVAKVLYEKWPAVKGKYLEACEQIPQSKRLGMTQLVDIHDDLLIVNMFAQEGYGRDGRQYLRYDKLEHCVRIVSSLAYDVRLPVYLPYHLGCGLAGGDWDIVTDILERNIWDAIICRKE